MNDDYSDLIARLHRIAKISYGATIEEGREVSKTQREAADTIERLCNDVAFERDLRASFALECKEARIEIAKKDDRIAALESQLAARESADLSIAERNAMARLNDCNSTPTPADRNIVIKLIERLCSQPAAAASEEKRTLTPHEVDVLLGDQMYIDSSQHYRNGTMTLTIKRKPRGASQKEQKE